MKKLGTYNPNIISVFHLIFLSYYTKFEWITLIYRLFNIIRYRILHILSCCIWVINLCYGFVIILFCTFVYYEKTKITQRRNGHKNVIHNAIKISKIDNLTIRKSYVQVRWYYYYITFQLKRCSLHHDDGR